MTQEVNNKCAFAREAGGVWAVDSPWGTFELFDVLHNVLLTVDTWFFAPSLLPDRYLAPAF